MVGAKTLTALFLLAMALAAAFSLGLVHLQRFLVLDGGTAFLVGCFTMAVGTLTFRFLRFGERSAHYFRFARTSGVWEGEAHFLGTAHRRLTIGENQGEAFDLPAWVMQLACLVAAFVLAMATFDGRSLTLLVGLTTKATFANSQYCPELDVQEEVDDPNAPGCALVRRAYELGYAKTLGACGTKKRSSELTEVCTLRQRDEPMFHYGWRLLRENYNKVRNLSEAGYLAKLKSELSVRMDRVQRLSHAKGQVLTNTPRSSHHIFTNLLSPHRDTLAELSQGNCLDRYRSLPRKPHTPDAKTHAGAVFEHVLAQLLFESRYDMPAGSCREYTIHWAAPKDACARLAASPQTFLALDKALNHVRAALDRHHLTLEVQRMEAQDMQTAPGRPSQGPPPPNKFISFQCYIEEERQGVLRNAHRFELLGRTFTAEETRVPAAAANDFHVDRYGYVASMLVRGFHYGGLVSEAGLDAGSVESALAQSFASPDYALSRVHGLASLDIFLEPDWIASREDLLQVYPYHVHLQNYVRLFRRQYARIRDRL